jgi:hypothetical protein
MTLTKVGIPGPVARSSSGSSSSGALVLLSSQTASGATALNFTSLISATYVDYMVKFINITAASTPSQLVLEVSTDNGGTYDSTAGHYGEYQLSSGGGSAAADSGLSTSLLIFPYTSARNMTTTANYVSYGTLLFSNPASANFKAFKGDYVAPDSVGASPFNLVSAGLYLQTTAFTAFRVRMLAGTFSGIVRLY